MRIMLSQINPCCGDLSGNLKLIQAETLFASQEGCHVVLLPELVTTAYPPRDLLYRQWIWDDNDKIAEQMLAFVKNLSRNITVIYGGLHQVKFPRTTERYNAAFIIDQKYGIRIYHKSLLPTYDVFDEARYFTSGADERKVPIPIDLGNDKTSLCSVLICEDMWNNNFSADPTWLPAAYQHDPIGELPDIDGPLFILNGSPFWEGKVKTTKRLVEGICKRLNRAVCWVNQIGAHDDIVTGGYSMVFSPHIKAGYDPDMRMGKLFEEERIIVELRSPVKVCARMYLGIPDGPSNPRKEDSQTFDKPTIGFDLTVDAIDFDDYCTYKACKLHVIDYMRRCGFKKAVFGASGGIDSAVVGAILAHALGSANVNALLMPSKFSSEGSVADAVKLCKNLGIQYEVISIADTHKVFRDTLLDGGKQKFNHAVTDENLQPRIRAVYLMAESNDEGSLLFTTGNKSEISVGYSTIYGDMSGGLGIIGDLWKTDVYRLARFINKYFGVCIPQETIDKPPSAELCADQKDTDSLPPYEVLDEMLKMLVEQDMDPEIVKQKLVEIPGGKDYIKRVNEIVRKIEVSEFKRQQMAVVPKLSRRSFGSGRRIAIASRISRI